MQKTTHLLLLDDTGARLVLRGEAPQPLPPPPAGPAQLARLLESTPRTGWRWLVERRDEYAMPTTVPLARGRDRHALLAHQRRKLQLDSPYHCCLSLAQRTEPRPEEDVLLCGLSDAQSLAPWLAVFAAHPGRLLGIHTPALLSAALGPRLPAPGDYRLLIQPGENLLRLSCLGPTGALHFSRSTPHPEPLAAAGSEVSQLLRYLRSQKTLPAQASPQLILISPSAPGPEITASLDGISEHPLHHLSPQQLAGQPCPDLASLFIQLALDARRAPDLRPTSLCRARQHQQLGQALGLGAGLALVSCLSYAAQTYWSSLDLDEEAARLQQQTQALEQQARTRLSQRPARHLSPEQLGRLEALDQRLHTRQQPPRPLLERVAEVLGQHPEFQLQQLEWYWPPLATTNGGPTPEHEHLQLQLEVRPTSATDGQAIDRLAARIGNWPGAGTPRVDMGHQLNGDAPPRWRISIDLDTTNHGQP